MAEKKINLEIARIDGLVCLKMFLPEEVEQFFKNLSDSKKQTSKEWFNDRQFKTGADFYAVNVKYDEIIKILSNKGLSVYNDFGDGLVKNRTINLAPLRCVGASVRTGVVLFGKSFSDSGLDFEWYVRELGVVMKYIWQEMISKKELKAVLTFEV